MTTTLTTLRLLLHDTPSPHAWKRIAHLLLSLDPDDPHTPIAIDYAQQHLQSWPNSLRTHPNPSNLSPQHPFCTLLRNLDLSSTPTNPDTLPETLTQPNLQHITHLNLSNTRLFNPNLHHHNLHPLTDHLPSLQHLHLANTSLNDLTLASILDSRHHTAPILTLNVASNPITDEHLHSLTQHPSLLTLQHLDLSFTRISPHSLPTLLRAPFSHTLQHLDLSGTLLRDDGLYTLSSNTTHLPSLSSLNLASTHLSSHAPTLLHTSPLLPSLQHLDLSQNPLGPHAFDPLQDNPLTTSLSSLNLASTHLSSHGTTSLLSSPLITTTLSSLNLARNSITPSTLQRLASSLQSQTPSLSSLNISSNPANISSILHILKTLPSLQHLHIQGIPLRDSDLQNIASTPSLQHLLSLHIHLRHASPKGLLSLLTSPHASPPLKRHLLLSQSRSLPHIASLLNAPQTSTPDDLFALLNEP